MIAPLADLAQLVSPVPWWFAIGVAVVVAAGAWNTGHLRADGAIAAVVVGTLVCRFHAAWALLLIVWFVMTSLVSRLGRAKKMQRTAHMLAKQDTRDALQVFANGGVFTALACLAMWSASVAGQTTATALTGMSWYAIAAAGALAAAAADTFATEIGTLRAQDPWSLRERARVPAGASGAVSWLGTTGSVLGAVLVAWCAWTVGMIPANAIAPVATAGVLGAFGDTVIGAWWQERRWCARCQRVTERTTHDCGTGTQWQGGRHHLTNDVVNFLCTVVGAILAVVLMWCVINMV